jgi:hypothetical protein
MNSNPAKQLSKGQFKCFECRSVFAQRDGDWHPWDHMQVHLCRGCERKTQQRPERATLAVTLN